MYAFVALEYILGEFLLGIKKLLKQLITLSFFSLKNS